MDMLGVFAEFETNLRQECQLEGIAAAKAKAKGVYKGRVKSINDDQIRELIQAGAKPSRVALDLGVSRASVYRALNKAA
jgi:DNA invertase Pin-like site-specific DNA recombinase